MEIQDLDLLDRVLLLEIQRLPIEEFIFFQYFYLSLAEHNNNNNTQETSIVFCLDDLYKTLEMNKKELRAFVCNPFLNLRSPVTFYGKDYFGTSGLIGHWHLDESLNTLKLIGWFFEKISLYKGLRLSNESKDQENFKRRCYKKKDGSGLFVRYTLDTLNYN